MIVTLFYNVPADMCRKLLDACSHMPYWIYPDLVSPDDAQPVFNIVCDKSKHVDPRPALAPAWSPAGLRIKTPESFRSLSVLASR